jgi:hypothetical protein
MSNPIVRTASSGAILAAVRIPRFRNPSSISARSQGILSYLSFPGHSGDIAEADLESGLAGFIIERDGRFLARVSEKALNPYGRPVFQGLQYSDTPPQPLASMRFTDTAAGTGKRHRYRVIAVNTVGLKSR